MPRLPAIFRTTAARLSALYLLLFAASALVLVVYMTSLSTRMLTDQTRETILEEVLSLSRSYEAGGLPRLVRVVAQRSRQPGAYLYLLTDPNGRPLAGNVESLEPGVLETDGWTERPFSYRRYGEGAATPPVTDGHKAIAQVVRLPNTMIVLVGRDLGEPEQFRLVVRRALTAALALMGIGAFVIWFFVGRQALHRIDSISEASRRIMGGDLSGRLPVTGSGDEFDRLSENLNGMLARIGALNDGLKQVSDNIAHDLKTPLTRLRNRVEATLAGAHTEAEYREALEGAIGESDQLIRTFNAILMISRLEAGYSAEATSEVDLAAIMRDVVELYEPAAEEAGVTLTAEDCAEAKVIGNRELIGQALSNIVDNAIKYSAGAEGGAKVAVSIVRAPGNIRLGVADNGPGIPPEDRVQATERFVRLEKSRSQPGSGLGLSLAKAVMTFHGGALELSGKEPGLLVEMVFPRQGG
nr:HAMP domain-containing sensor histidine kinase [Mesorhizobium sp.]